MWQGGRQLKSVISLGVVGESAPQAKSPERVVTATELRSTLQRGEPALWKSATPSSVEQCGGVALSRTPAVQ